MGMRYVIFRVKYALETKLGILKKRFPVNPEFKVFISLKDWRNNTPVFFFESREFLQKMTSPPFRGEMPKAEGGIFTFFSSTEFNLGKDYDWITNPETGYQYDINKHWSEIADLSKEAGDIKYVWEKARFSWVYTLIRYDLYSGEDQSAFVFSEIEDFIDKNLVNQGPNYKCSQEISLRTLNWTFALYYYKNSKILTEELFRKIINHIYWQIHHVYHNIDFSRIAVRNNHALTETLMLYLSHFLFPFIPETEIWSNKGKKWFEQEIAYQIYEDGSFLQFSHNYHRVVVQLLTWGIKLSELNNDRFSEIVYTRAQKAIAFLYNQQDVRTGWLPNYGMNDGALFFPLNDNHYRDYRPQLQALANALGFELYEKEFEDSWWFNQVEKIKEKSNLHHTLGLGQSEEGVKRKNTFSFDKGGFYGFRERDTLTTIRCGTYKDRPAQADALNLDIWYKGKNVIFDPGTYKYNTNEKYLNFYHGTVGHNTITIGDHDQMKKGGRFIWYFWTKAYGQTISETENTYKFEGKIKAFPKLGSNIVHHRKVIKYKGIPKWKVVDIIENYSGELPIVQHWNIADKVFFTHLIGVNKKSSDNLTIQIQAFGKDGKALKKEYQKGWYSEKYGVKKEFDQLIFQTYERFIETNIEIKNEY